MNTHAHTLTYLHQQLKLLFCEFRPVSHWWFFFFNFSAFSVLQDEKFSCTIDTDTASGNDDNGGSGSCDNSDACENNAERDMNAEVKGKIIDDEGTESGSVRNQ